MEFNREHSQPWLSSNSLRRTCVALLAANFLLITIVCCRDTFWLIARGFTLLPTGAITPATHGELIASTVLGQRLPQRNFLRQTLDLYLHSAGIESGYGFFAPNVGGTSKLIFELHFADGRVAYEPAGVDPKESGLRFASFMDFVSRTQSQPLRDILIRSLAEPIWQRHPDLVKIRAILGTLSYPSPAELLDGTGAAYHFVAAYDLTRPESSPAPKKP